MSQLQTRDLLALSPLLTDKVRLAIIVTLTSSPESLDFKELIEKLDLTKGNLSSHMRKLEEAGLITVNKEFLDRKPRTTYTITTKGKSELKSYLETIEELIQSTR